MHGIEKRYVFLFPAPQVLAWGLAFAVLPCFLLVGLGASTCGGIRGCLSVDCFDRWFLPNSSALGAGLPGLLLLELLPPSRSGCGSYRCPSCSSHPSPAWFSSKTSASWVLTVALAPDSERAFAFGRSLCSVSSSASSPSTLVASWCGG